MENEQQIARITNKLMDMIKQHVSEKNASAPNIIFEFAVDLLIEEGFGQETAELIGHHVFELTSLMVKDIGEYR